MSKVLSNMNIIIYNHNYKVKNDRIRIIGVTYIVLIFREILTNILIKHTFY